MKNDNYCWRKNKKEGFTLTEILVVVMVIAVLAAVAYPLYTKAVTKSRAIEAINLLEMVRNKQLSKYARDQVYYTNASGLGQLTTDLNQEEASGQVLQIKDYTISLNAVKNCATATYSKGSTSFSFSSGYETAGLGCTGDICASFGDILGTAQQVCNCGSKSCNSGYTLNDTTCNCDCNAGCDQNGSCFAPYGGGNSRPCSSGCGTETSSSTCNGPTWNGTCGTATQTQPTSQTCGNSGTQTRTCTPSCGGGTCGAWGACTGQTCPASTKPATSQSCGNCGTQSRTVTCNASTGTWTLGSWGTCTGGGVCVAGATQSCNGTGTQTCSSSCAWGTCSVVTCDSATKPATSQACGNCNTGTQTRTVTCNSSTGTWTSDSWGTCTGGGVCAAGATQNCNGSGTQICSSSCTWGTCSVISCEGATKPVASQSCGNCNTGTQTRTVTCNSSNGTWSSDTWGTCTGGGACAVGATQTCGGNGIKTCSSSCAWGPCVCNSGYSWNGSTCVAAVNISTTTINILVTYNFEIALVNYQACYAKEVTGTCASVESKTYYQGGSLGFSGGMQGPSMCQMGAEGTEGHGSGWVGGSVVSISACPSGTNQSVCAANCTQPGCSYRCILSESYPTTSSPYIDRRCVYPCEIDSDVGCNDDSGTATVLVCSRS